MSVMDLLFRVMLYARNRNSTISISSNRELNASADDAFARLYYDAVQSEIEAATHKSKMCPWRRVKGHSKEELITHNDLVLALLERIQAIPDGAATSAKQTGGWETDLHKNIKFDPDGRLIVNFFNKLKIRVNFRKNRNMENEARSRFRHYIRRFGYTEEFCS
ncbi:hypothetical protein F0562_021800 [Nyssa sinensis]|uniref:Uncharacterized protein n=1 Tax=Nyssa sinensis TaxID=561372 RepID=A0A5J5BQM2_9ASTE|nr:hypothetical protein F0562_021800 [Nyssa sinensis]